MDVTRGPRVPRDVSSQGCLPAWVIPSLNHGEKSAFYFVFKKQLYPEFLFVEHLLYIAVDSGI